MNTYDLITKEELPPGFEFPPHFLRLLDRGLTNLAPWHIYNAKLMRLEKAHLAELYPARALVPFARRQDNDDIACWEGADSTKVYIVHDFCGPGHEQRQIYPTLYDWLKEVMREVTEFDY